MFPWFCSAATVHPQYEEHYGLKHPSPTMTGWKPQFLTRANVHSTRMEPIKLNKPANPPGNKKTKRGKNMEIKRAGSQPSAKGPAEWFTGTVRIDPLFQAPEPARGRGASVTFEPGARTAWHTHPLGQTLIVTAGCGLAQRWGGPIEAIRPG